MKIVDGKIAEATRDEMFDYYLARDFDDVMPFSEFLRRCEEKGTRITDSKEGRREVKLTAEQVATILHEVFMCLTQGNYDFTVQVGDVVIKCTEEGGAK